MFKLYQRIKSIIHLPLLALYAKVLTAFFLLRLLFVLTNGSTFTKIDFNLLFDAFLFGLRLDLILTFYIVSAVYLLFVITKATWLANIITSSFSFIIITIALIDSLYFKFLKEHIDSQFFTQLNPDNNISLWTYVLDYWYMALLGLVSTICLSLWLSKSFRKKANPRWLSLALTITISFLIARGGLRLKPLRTADSGQYLPNTSHVVAYNVPLFIYETWRNPVTQPAFIKHYQSELTTSSFKKDTTRTPNFVIVILESFGKEYTGLNRGMTHTYTPFLNSLMNQSICCHNAYANGLKSVDAVPAIFTGLPKLSSSAIIHSPKSSKETTSIFNCLTELGYSSSFFHGAHEETMGFKTYLTTNGLDKYYSVEDYPNTSEDHDGHWGIFDEPYLQFVSNKLSEQQQPFVSGVFTLSSHHPYVLPNKYSDSFSRGNIPIHRSIRYADRALEKFMSSCKKSTWFDNTIFIITADHSAENLLHAYRTPSGKYEIPLLLYSPKLLKPEAIRKTVSQIDILPTILDYVGYPNPVKVLGNSIFSQNNAQYVAHYDNNIYHITKNNWSYGVHAQDAKFLFNKNEDINCLTNVAGNFSQMEATLDSNLKDAVNNYFYVVEQQ